MRRIGARHKRPQRFGWNEHAAQHPDGWQCSARDQALHRANGDTAELFRGLSEAVCKSFIVHWVHPIASKSSICPVFVQFLSSVCPVIAIHQPADALRRPILPTAREITERELSKGHSRH